MIYFESTGRHKHVLIVAVDKQDAAKLREGQWVRFVNNQGRSTGFVITKAASKDGIYITLGTNNSVKRLLLDNVKLAV